MALDIAVMLGTLSKSSVEVSREERRLAITAATGVAEMRNHLEKNIKSWSTGPRFLRNRRFQKGAKKCFTWSVF